MKRMLIIFVKDNDKAESDEKRWCLQLHISDLNKWSFLFGTAHSDLTIPDVLALTWLQKTWEAAANKPDDENMIIITKMG